MVHPHGRRRSSIRAQGAGRDRATPISCRMPGRNRIGQHGRRRGRTGASAASAPGACRSRCSSSARTGEPLRDPAGDARASSPPSASEGADAWYTSPPERFLGPGRNPDDYEQVTRHRRRLVRERLDPRLRAGGPRPALAGRPLSRRLRPASRLVPFLAAGSGGHARARAVQGGADPRLRARRAGPQDVASRSATSSRRRRSWNKYGADILRLWVMNVRHHRGPAHRPGDPEAAGRAVPPPAQHAALAARQPRRLHAGRARAGRRDAGAGTLGAAPPGGARLRRCRAAVETHDWTGVYPALHAFCATDLSAFYFDVRKDALYCDRPDSLRRRAARTVLDHLHRCLTTWLAPVLVFTAEEAWLARFGEDAQRASAGLPGTPGRWQDEALARAGRRSATSAASSPAALERARAEGTIGASLQAAPVLHLPAEPADAAVGGGLGGAGDRVGARRCPPHRRRRTHSATPTWPAWPSRSRAPPARNAPAAGACCRRSGSSRGHPALCLPLRRCGGSGLVCRAAA